MSVLYGVNSMLSGAIAGTFPLFAALAQYMNYGPLRPSGYGGSERTLLYLVAAHAAVFFVACVKYRTGFSVTGAPS